MRGLLVAALLAACHRPVYLPWPDDPQVARTAYVVSDCGGTEPDDFGGGMPWDATSVGVGLVLGPKQVVTASHVVRCPEIPSVTVVLSNGRRMWSYVEQDDYDELATVDPIGQFDEYGGPGDPVERAGPVVGEVLCVTSPRARRCGAIVAIGLRRFSFAVRSHPGDSGSPIWDSSDHLVGVLQGADEQGWAVASRY